MRTLAIDGLPAWSRIGLGTWQFGSREWGYGDAYAGRTAHDIVARSLEKGVTLFDSAEIYAFGRSERILGEALGDRRDDVTVATKIFPVAPFAPVVAQRGVASAARLGVQTIDLYQVHQPNPLVGDGTIMTGMRRLQAVGLVDEVGVSNYTLDRWQAAERALGSRVLSNQVQYSLADTRPDRRMIGWAAGTGRVVIAYSPLAQGLLTARYDADHPPSGAVRKGNPLFLPENLERAHELLGTLREVAATHDAAPAQVALAWTLRHPNVVAIPGASSVRQAEQNAEAADLELTIGETDALTDAARRFRPVTGAKAVRGLLTQRLPFG